MVQEGVRAEGEGDEARIALDGDLHDVANRRAGLALGAAERAEVVLAASRRLRLPTAKSGTVVFETECDAHLSPRRSLPRHAFSRGPGPNHRIPGHCGNSRARDDYSEAISFFASSCCALEPSFATS